MIGIKRRHCERILIVRYELWLSNLQDSEHAFAQLQPVNKTSSEHTSTLHPLTTWCWVLMFLFNCTKNKGRAYLAMPAQDNLLRDKGAVNWRGAMAIDASSVIPVSMGEKMDGFPLRGYAPSVYRKRIDVLHFHPHLDALVILHGLSLQEKQRPVTTRGPCHQIDMPLFQFPTREGNPNLDFIYPISWCTCWTTVRANYNEEATLNNNPWSRAVKRGEIWVNAVVIRTSLISVNYWNASAIPCICILLVTPWAERMELICPYFNSLKAKRTLNSISSSQFLEAHAGPLWEQNTIKRRLPSLNRGRDSRETPWKTGLNWEA